LLPGGVFDSSSDSTSLAAGLGLAGLLFFFVAADAVKTPTTRVRRKMSP
jgi:hypothetical protein